MYKMNNRITLSALELHDVINTPNTLPEPYNNAGSATVVGITKQFVKFDFRGIEWKEKKTFTKNGVVRDNHCILSTFTLAKKHLQGIEVA
jgi:hypothetical protein